MDALAFVEQTKRPEPAPVYIVYGPEQFLKRKAIAHIHSIVLGDSADDMARTVLEGDTAELALVLDELHTLPFLSKRRLVIVQDAESFVSKHRDALERYVKQPGTTGVLVLDVQSWRSNTRLAKAVPASDTIKCESPAAFRLPQWCSRHAKSAYEKELPSSAAGLLVELIGQEMGVLDQEIRKLASYVGSRPRIQNTDVDALVGHSRTETAWRMLDDLADGRPGDSLDKLNRLFDQGEQPIAVLGAISWQLRQLAQVARLCQNGVPARQAMGQAKVPPFAQKKIDQYLRALGPRALNIYQWLLEADLGLKSSGGLPPRATVERLLLRVAGR